MLLSAFGVSEGEEQAYRSVLRMSECSVGAVAASCGCDATQAGRWLRELEDKGLVNRTSHRPARYRAAPPELAFEVLALDRHRQIDQARLAAAEFGRIRRAAEPGLAAPIRVIQGEDVNTQRFLQTQLTASREVLMLDRPPYLAEGIAPQHQLQLERMAQGVSYRTVYDRLSLAEPGQIERAHELSRGGEQARVYDGVPLKLLITDRSSALVPFALEDVRHSVVLDRSPLLDGLVAVFEFLWERATPLWSLRAGDILDPMGERLLGLAAAGYTDEVIARTTGLSKRTVERRMRQMMDRLGARTRFQAGLQAGRRGLID
ncbi:helix-turn-helix domain-containing protein [Kitasatospora sp. NPDC057015]|uniref:helix-turn-helix transcriptional regulator n=1 Tax=Kitasatospora sp. NPDC057015 TaxID=3346001 RepID=UPI00362FAE7A